MCQYQVILIDFIKLDDRWDLETIKNGIYSQSEYDGKKLLCKNVPIELMRTVRDTQINQNSACGKRIKKEKLNE